MTARVAEKAIDRARADAKAESWNLALAPSVPWQVAYKAVADVAKRLLDVEGAEFEGAGLTTAQLVEALYPERYAVGEGITARSRIYKALAAMAKHDLAAYCSKGDARPLKHTKKLVKPWIWHAPRVVVEKPVRTCPHCGEEIL